MSIKNVLVKLAKQKNTSPFIGALTSAYSSAGILYSPLTLIGVATTVYGLWGADLLRKWFPWFTFYYLVGLLVLFMLMMMVFFYKVIIPSQYAFSVQQQYKHRNPLVEDMHKVLKQQKKTNKRLGDIEKRLGKLEQQPK